MKFSFTIEGAAELDRQLATLGERVHRKVVRQAVRAGQKIMQTAVRASARSMVGGQMGEQMARALQIRAPQKQQPGSYSLHVQLRRDVPEFIHTTRHGLREYIPAAIEYGHFVGRTYVAPIPFGRTAAAAVQGEVIRAYTDELRKGLLREAIIARYK